MDVAAWLNRLGLEQYEQAFRENDVDAEVLRELTAEDLIGLGVTSIGHRRKLLAAIAALRETPPPAGEALAPITTPAGQERLSGLKSSSAERRQLTVMFCDLVGSTALSARLDPEDLREIIGAYHECVAETIEQYDGFVARYMGDGVLVYFGYPRAHEDDAERAVRAGLAQIEAIRHLRTAEKLQIRIGIATGLVVIGELIRSSETQEWDIVGQTPNLAARLQALAEPNTIVIGPMTRRLVGNLFDYRDLGAVELRGFAQPLPAYQVLRPSTMESRFEALRSEVTPLVGRDEELDVLLQHWQQAKAGDGRVVLVSGEPGIGKSRLIAALSQALQSEPHTRLRYFCSPYHQDSALYPFVIQLERAAEFARDDTVEQKLAKLRGLLVGGARSEDEVELVAELLSLPSTAADLNLSPRHKREKLFNAFLHQFEVLARSRPVLLVFEDAHWIDPSSRELLDLTIERVCNLPVLLISSFRPDFDPPWNAPHVTALALHRLGGCEAGALVERVASNTGLSPDLVDEIVERADGVPLFLEELTKAVLESDNRVASVLAARPLSNPPIPTTLHASLVARLDRLGPIPKEVGQISAVVGREFGYDLIEQVVPRPVAELRVALDQLTKAGLLLCRGAAPQSSYLFKHVLVQDAAYSTLLRAKRQELHARVAAVLEQHFADLIERQPEFLAHHLTAAGSTERAADQWLRAGRHAAERSAHLEAIRQFGRSLASLMALPEGPARDEREIELQLARGPSLFAAKGYSSPEAAEAYTRARELAEQRGDARQLFMAVYGLWQSAGSSRRILATRELSDRLLQLTADKADDGLHLQAHHSAWITCMAAGEPAAAREHCEAGRRLYDPERHHSHRLIYGGHDPGVCAANLSAQAHWVLGYPDQALTIGSEALALAERIRHPLSLEEALVYNAKLHVDRGEPELALQRLMAAESLVAEARLSFALEPRFLRGAALTAQGALAEAVACLREGIASRRAAMRLPVSGLASLADALGQQREYEAALSAAREAIEAQEQTGFRWLEAELHRLKGIALAGLHRLEEGQYALEEALRIARRQEAKAYELRAAVSLARLRRDQGRRTEARDLLAPVYGWFTEGFDTPDLKEAKALLDELG